MNSPERPQNAGLELIISERSVAAPLMCCCSTFRTVSRAESADRLSNGTHEEVTWMFLYVAPTDSRASFTPACSSVLRYTGAPATTVAVINAPTNAPTSKRLSPATRRYVSRTRFRVYGVSAIGWFGASSRYTARCNADSQGYRVGGLERLMRYELQCDAVVKDMSRQHDFNRYNREWLILLIVADAV